MEKKDNKSLYVALLLIVTLLIIVGSCSGSINFGEDFLISILIGYPIIQILSAIYLVYNDSKSIFGYILLISGIILLIGVGTCFAAL
jgi:type III secretory pathway component EscV